MPKIKIPHMEGYQFVCNLCQKAFKVTNNKHQEIDRLQKENLSESMGSSIEICNGCYQKENKKGNFDPP